jgi:SAM-dependent methyltransferase
MGGWAAALPAGAVDLGRRVRQVSRPMVADLGEQRGTVSRLNEADYYEAHHLSDDRLALWWYARVVRRLCPKGGRLLDFGCGTGHLLKRLSAHGEAFGYDSAPLARGRSRRNAPDAVVLEDWESLPVATFDIIVALHTLEHLRHPLVTLQLLTSKLVAGGIFFFVVPNPGGIGRRLKGRQWFAYRDPTHVSLLSRGEWVTLARTAGLGVVSVCGDGLWDAPYVRILPTGVQRALFGAPAAVQVLSPFCRPFLPAALGECLIVTARKPLGER